MFIGRERELQLLRSVLQKPKSATLVYGKRKVGKTTLIQEACKHIDKPIIYYECIRDTIESNVERLLDALRRQGLVDRFVTLEKKTIKDLFMFLNGLNQDIVLVIDEYPYLKEFASASTVDSMFQDVIDHDLNHIDLIFTGSHIGIMKDNLQEKNALFGRFDLIILLTELDYLESSSFYPNKSPYEKAAFYSVFGGSPFVNQFIDPSKDLEANIVDLLLNPNSPVYLYAANLLLSDLSNTAQINRVFAVLKNGRKSYGELESVLDAKRTGLLSKILKPILEMGLITKTAPINRMSDAKKAKYEINDNLMRFYQTYVSPINFLLGRKSANSIFEEEIEPTLTEYVSRRFEAVCRDFLWKFVSKKGLRGIENIGTYYYDDPVSKTNGEFDLAVLKKNGDVDIIEVKYLKGRVDQAMVAKEEKQVRSIKEINIGCFGFISINGFNENVSGLAYQFTGEDVFDFRHLHKEQTI